MKPKYQDLLHLASQSKARKQLLEWARIPFTTITQTYDEELHPHHGNITELVQELALKKMEHVVMPPTEKMGKKLFIVTADTLIANSVTQTVFRKPQDKEDAKKMLTQIGAQPVVIQTGCCVSVREWNGVTWQTLHQKVFAIGASVEFCVDADQMENYFLYEPNALNACGASVVDSFGQCFFKSIQGSYSAILGLPLWELRMVLKEFEFVF